jgi:adiponectin receptor
MFVGMGVSAIFPVFDGVRIFGIGDMEMQIGLSWLVLQGALYIVGAGLYAVSMRSCRYNSHLLT